MFGLDNLPYGVFEDRVVVRYGEHVLDLAAALGDEVFHSRSLNAFMALGRPAWQETRRRIQAVLRAGTDHLIPLAEVELRLPIDVADYVDFYCSLEHATNLGRLFRPGEEPLKPNWRHLPVGYHGRAGTVVVSGTPIRRPYGQVGGPHFGPTAKLDIEAELGFVVGVGTQLGERPGAFEDHVFGVTLVNDWSARDIQSWEYVPLGPFLGKSFATSISPWITPLEALEHARVPGREQDPEPLGYLRRSAPWGLDLRLKVELNGKTVSEPPYRDMYWTPDQMLAHMTVNGASLRTGDLFASGTVSGVADPGSFIELGQGFLDDGDTVIITATTNSGMSLGAVAGIIT
ncbi:putative fumarylacetoacetase [Acrocarpospora pleiomorpha]|uniref:fumarylacetoacetase n=1 Tax=Acrocarpospora pleiomorpha TaxID=90975 RepID=A0A5M3XS43_9ACTN|nr:fumarylacetoacetate hydrolase family protein [Acrocarpospora pleiomorpha]GES21228.1 putative fumarylacetoacetase [Acrocarpospora pleiomorpha]